jgi:hypothetical protein
MESLGFVLMYFLRGSLPWQGLKASTKKKKYARILERKQATAASLLCRGYPVEFRQYFEHCSSLGFEDPPDYRLATPVFVTVIYIGICPERGHLYVCSDTSRNYSKICLMRLDLWTMPSSTGTSSMKAVSPFPWPWPSQRTTTGTTRTTATRPQHTAGLARPRLQARRWMPTRQCQWPLGRPCMRVRAPTIAPTCTPTVAEALELPVARTHTRYLESCPSLPPRRTRPTEAALPGTEAIATVPGKSRLSANPSSPPSATPCLATRSRIQLLDKLRKALRGDWLLVRMDSW